MGDIVNVLLIRTMFGGGSKEMPLCTPREMRVILGFLKAKDASLKICFNLLRLVPYRKPEFVYKVDWGRNSKHGSWLSIRALNFAL